MTLADRLIEKLKENGVSQSSLAKAIGKTQQNIQKLLAGKIKHPTDLKSIADHLSTTVEYLEYGITPEYYSTNSLYCVPVINIDSIKTINDPAIKGDLRVEKLDMFKRGYEKCVSYRIATDSMAPILNKGDMVIVDILDKYPKDGNIIISRKKDLSASWSFKRYVHEDGKAYLKSLKADIPISEVNGNLEILGIVRFVRRPDLEL